MKRIISAVAALVLAMFGGLAVASPAGATEAHHATGTWQLRDFIGTYPDYQTPDAEKSTATCDTLTLEKVAGETGTSMENTNLGLAVAAGDTIVVGYETSSTDNAAAGAVRMFGYDHADADTINDGPDFGPAIAGTGSTTGTLTLTFAADATVGTFGLTYDASNATTGTVTFTELTWVSGETETPISFCAAPEPSETATETTTGGTLPVTGSSLTVVLVVAGGLVIIGGIVFVLARRVRG